MTDTAQVINTAVQTTAGFSLWHLIAAFIGGLFTLPMGKKLVSGVTPAQIDAAEKDVAAIGGAAAPVLALAGQPAAAAIVGHVAAIAQQANVAHAELQAATAAAPGTADVGTALDNHIQIVTALRTATDLIKAVTPNAPAPKG